MDRRGWRPATRRSPARLRETGLPVIFAVNKTDDKRAQAAVPEFYQLGFEPVLEISAEHGNGVGDLLDEIVDAARARRAATAPRAGRPDAEARKPRPHRRDCRRPDRRKTTIAIIGRPNVGKSSLLNRLLKEERVMVSDMPGTTRDAIDATLTWHRRQFRIVDTAGMRRPGRVRSGGKVELVSVAGAQEGDLRRRRRRAAASTRRKAPPIRMRRSAARPTAPAAAWSSSRTSGTW